MKGIGPPDHSCSNSYTTPRHVSSTWKNGLPASTRLRSRKRDGQSRSDQPRAKKLSSPSETSGMHDDRDPVAMTWAVVPSSHPSKLWGSCCCAICDNRIRWWQINRSEHSFKPFQPKALECFGSLNRFCPPVSWCVEIIVGVRWWFGLTVGDIRFSHFLFSGHFFFPLFAHPVLWRGFPFSCN